jgi:hypothetical protein
MGDSAGVREYVPYMFQNMAARVFSLAHEGNVAPIRSNPQEQHGVPFALQSEPAGRHQGNTMTKFRVAALLVLASLGLSACHDGHPGHNSDHHHHRHDHDQWH